MTFSTIRKSHFHNSCLVDDDIHANADYAENVYFFNLREKSSSERRKFNKLINLIIYYVKLFIFIYRSNSPVVHNVSTTRAGLIYYL